MNIAEYSVNEIVKRGWDLQIGIVQGQPVKIVAWRPEWVTSELYASRPCETITGDSLTDALAKAFRELT